MPTLLFSVADVAVGVVLLGAAAASWSAKRTSRVGLIMAMAGVCWFLGSAVPSMIFLHRGPMVHLHLSYPTGRLRGRLALPVVVASYAAAIYEGFARSAWLTGGLSALIAVAAGDVFTRTSGPARKAGGPALAAAVTFAGVLALSSVNVLLHLEADVEVALGYDIAVCAVVAWLAADLRYGRWTEAAIADLVTHLGGRTDTSGLQADLRRALGDPTLTIGYWDPRL